MVTYLLEARQAQNPGVLVVGAAIFMELTPRPCLQKGEKAARALLLTFALERQCTYDFCSLGSYPGEGTNSQLIGIECGVT